MRLVHLIRAAYNYFGGLKFPNAETATQFEQMVNSAEWYNYLDQVNAIRPASTPQNVIGDIISS